MRITEPCCLAPCQANLTAAWHKQIMLIMITNFKHIASLFFIFDKSLPCYLRHNRILSSLLYLFKSRGMWSTYLNLWLWNSVHFKNSLHAFYSYKTDIRLMQTKMITINIFGQVSTSFWNGYFYLTGHKKSLHDARHLANAYPKHWAQLSEFQMDKIVLDTFLPATPPYAVVFRFTACNISLVLPRPIYRVAGTPTYDWFIYLYLEVLWYLIVNC